MGFVRYSFWVLFVVVVNYFEFSLGFEGWCGIFEGLVVVVGVG